MTSRWKLWALSLLVLALPACFQEAGEALQSTGSTAEPIATLDSEQAFATLEPVEGNATDESEIDEGVTEATVDANAPTRIPLTVISQPTNNLPAVDTATPVAPDEQQAVATQPQFITPVSPLVPEAEMTVETFIPAQATSSALITPTAFSNDAAEAESPITASTDPACLYSVQSGDNLYRIAINNGTTIEQMRTANPSLTGENPVLQIGQELQLPNCEGGSGSPDVQAPPQPTALPGSSAIGTQEPATGNQETYTVRPGDTLFIIAQRLGTTVSALQQANQLTNPDRLDVGQILLLP